MMKLVLIYWFMCWITCIRSEYYDIGMRRKTLAVLGVFYLFVAPILIPCALFSILANKLVDLRNRVVIWLDVTAREKRCCDDE